MPHDPHDALTALLLSRLRGRRSPDAIGTGPLPPRRPAAAGGGLAQPCHLAVGETVILLHPPLPHSRRFNTDGEGMPVK